MVNNLYLIKQIRPSLVYFVWSHFTASTMALYYNRTEPINDVLALADRVLYLPKNSVILFSSTEYRVFDIPNKAIPENEDESACVYIYNRFILTNDSTVEALKIILKNLGYDSMVAIVSMDETTLSVSSVSKIPEKYGVYRVVSRREPDNTTILKLDNGIYIPVVDFKLYVDTYVQVENKIYMFVLDKSKEFHVFIFDPIKEKLKKSHKTTKPISKNRYTSTYVNGKVYIYTNNDKYLNVYDIKGKEWENLEFEHEIIAIFQVRDSAYTLLDNSAFYEIDGYSIKRKMGLPEGYRDVQKIQNIVSNGKYIVIVQKYGEEEGDYYPNVIVYNVSKKKYKYSEVELHITQIVYDPTGYSVNRNDGVFLLYDSHKNENYIYILNPNDVEFSPTMFSYRNQIPFYLSTE